MPAVKRLAAALLASCAAAASAHDGGGDAVGWTLDPAITVPLLVALILFLIGARRLRRRMREGEALRRRVWLFAGGWLVLAGALVSPLHEAGERSFAMHMAEHELIMLLAAPLLVLGEPLVVMLWALPAGARRAIGAMATVAPVRGGWRLLTGAAAATLIQAAVLWLWHAPALFDLALASDGWHAIQHGCFLASALLFWTAMLRRRTPAGVAALCLVVTAIVTGALGALMAFASSPWYPRYAALGMAPFGLTPAEDQQVAGLLMWVPGGMVHAGVALALMRRLLKSADV